MSNDLIAYQQHALVPVSSNNVDAYVQSLQSIEVLSPEEETALAERYNQNSDLEAARALVMHNLRFVVKIARGYSGYGLPLADLIQEGNVGLMKAVQRFDSTRQVRVVSFAVHWIRAEIHEYILRNWKVVKLATTKAQRKLFFNLRSSKKRLGWLNQTEVKEIATDLGVSESDVMEMEKRMNGQDVSFDAPTADDDDSSSYSPSQYLIEHNADPAERYEEENWQSHTNDKLANAIAELDERSQTILKKRWMAEKKSTLHDLAAEFNVSAERIRQIENMAMGKIREAM